VMTRLSELRPTTGRRYATMTSSNIASFDDERAMTGGGDDSVNRRTTTE